jgi:hypothetical protein
MNLTHNMLVELLARKEAQIVELESRVVCQAERLEQQKPMVEAFCRWVEMYEGTLWATKVREGKRYDKRYDKESPTEGVFVNAIKVYDQYKDVLKNEPNSTDAGGVAEAGMESAGGGEVDSPDPHPL